LVAWTCFSFEVYCGYINSGEVSYVMDGYISFTKTAFFAIIISMNTIAVKKVNNQIKALVSRAVFDVFNDPDFGLDLSSRTRKKLLTPSKSTKTIPLSQIKKKYF